MDIRPLRTKEDHGAALREIDRLWGAPVGSDDGDRLEVFLALVEPYEDGLYPSPPADPLGVVRYVMDQNGYTQKDLADVLGSRSRASELLSGRRSLTLDQIRRLSHRWRIPAAALIGEMATA
ncbi:MAG TPA: helix-turn-helix domain-containing protein [Caulobacteraceae bacterium]